MRRETTSLVSTHYDKSQRLSLQMFCSEEHGTHTFNQFPWCTYWYTLYIYMVCHLLHLLSMYCGYYNLYYYFVCFLLCYLHCSFAALTPELTFWGDQLRIFFLLILCYLYIYFWNQYILYLLKKWLNCVCFCQTMKGLEKRDFTLHKCILMGAYNLTLQKMDYYAKNSLKY